MKNLEELTAEERAELEEAIQGALYTLRTVCTDHREFTFRIMDADVNTSNCYVYLLNALMILKRGKK